MTKDTRDMGGKKWYGAAGVLAGAVVVAAAVAGGPTLARVSAEPAARTEVGSSKQFMEIKSGEFRDGRVYLEVRPAAKEVLGESFVTVPVPGPYSEVVLTPNARILHLSGESGSHAVFVDLLKKRSPNRPGHVNPDQRTEGFDLTFDGEGHVTQIDWLYVP